MKARRRARPVKKCRLQSINKKALASLSLWVVDSLLNKGACWQLCKGSGRVWPVTDGFLQSVLASARINISSVRTLQLSWLVPSLCKHSTVWKFHQFVFKLMSQRSASYSITTWLEIISAVFAGRRWRSSIPSRCRQRCSSGRPKPSEPRSRRRSSMSVPSVHFNCFSLTYCTPTASGASPVMAMKSHRRRRLFLSVCRICSGSSRRSCSRPESCRTRSWRLSESCTSSLSRWSMSEAAQWHLCPGLHTNSVFLLRVLGNTHTCFSLKWNMSKTSPHCTATGATISRI